MWNATRPGFQWQVYPHLAVLAALPQLDRSSARGRGCAAQRPRPPAPCCCAFSRHTMGTRHSDINTTEECIPSTNAKYTQGHWTRQKWWPWSTWCYEGSICTKGLARPSPFPCPRDVTARPRHAPPHSSPPPHPLSRPSLHNTPPPPSA